METTFSIIIPTFNRSSYLLKIIKKLVISQYNLEIIVCDSRSKDQTKKKIEVISLLNKHQNIKYIDIHKNNHSRKRNIGIKNAKGKYIILLDDDCIPEKNFLRKYKKLLDSIKNKKIIISGSVDYNFYTLNKNFIRYRQSRHFIIKNDKDFGKKFLKPQKVIIMNMGFERKLLQKFKLFFDERFNRYGFEDFEFAFRLNKKNIKVVPGSPLVTHWDDRNFETYLNKIKFIAYESSKYLNKINPQAAKKNNFIKLENNFIFERLSKNKIIFNLSRILEKFFISLDRTIFYIPFIYKFSIALAYLQGSYLKNQKNKRLLNLQNWYK